MQNYLYFMWHQPWYLNDKGFISFPGIDLICRRAATTATQYMEALGGIEQIPNLLSNFSEKEEKPTNTAPILWLAALKMSLLNQ